MQFIFSSLFSHFRLPSFLCLLFGFGLHLSAQAGVMIQTWHTGNGVPVYFAPTHVIPVLDISVSFDAGSRRDPENRAGLASLTSLMLGRGITVSASPKKKVEMTEAQISDAFANVGARWQRSADNDKASVVLRTLSAKTVSDRAIEVFSRMLAYPLFSQSVLDRDKKRVIAGIREAMTQPDTIASVAYKKALYGSHPYGYSSTPESVGNITVKDIQAFHQKYYVSNTAVIAIVGDASTERAKEIAEQLSQGLKQASPDETLPALPGLESTVAHDKFIDHSAKQSHIMIGMPALTRGDPDFFPLMVGNYILGGGGFVSRLMQEVREKRGLSYSVYSQFDSRLQPGPFTISLQTQKTQTGAALKVVRETVENFLAEGPSEKELKAAKDNLIKGFPLRMDNNAKLISLLSLIGYYGLPLDYLDTWTSRVEAVTVEDVKQAFNRKLDAKKMSTIVVGEVLN